MIIPGEENSKSFIFGRREIAYLKSISLDCETYYFNNKSGAKGFLSSVLDLKSMIKKGSFDIVHAHFGTQTGLLALLAKGKAKLVVTFRGTDLNWSPHLSFFRNLFGKSLSYLVMFFADQVICVSAAMSRYAHLVNRKCFVSPTGINTDTFHPIGQETCLEELGWRKDRKHIVFNAGYDPRNKRLDIALQLIAQIHQHTPSVDLHIMRGDVEPHDVPKWMNGANLVLMLSDHEGSPTVVQEALACGTSILTFAVGDVNEILKDVENAEIVPRDLNELTNAALRLLKLPKCFNSHAVKRIDYKYLSSRTLELYQTMV